MCLWPQRKSPGVGEFGTQVGSPEMGSPLAAVPPFRPPSVSWGREPSFACQHEYKAGPPLQGMKVAASK